jgi:hypothetical protein
MDDIKIEGIIEPIKPQPVVDPRKAVLDRVLEAFKSNPGKWVKLGIAGDTPQVKKNKIRSLRKLITKLSKSEQAYGVITLVIDERDGQFNVCAKEQPIRRRASAKRKKKTQEAQPQQPQ